MNQFKPKIIAIDDEPIVLELYTRIFAKVYEATVITTTDSTEVLTLVLEQPPDLFITDLFHPGVSGISLIEKLRAEEATKFLPIWVISGQARTKHGIIAADVGADLVIKKPFSYDELIGRANRLFNYKFDPDEALIDLGFEAPDLDYKENLELNTKFGCASFAKDVIAFANYGGGSIVLGVSEPEKGRFRKVGLNPNEIEKVEVTLLNKALRDYIEPPHHISSKVIKQSGLIFVIVKIPPANEVPLLAKKQHERANLFPGRIYTRNSAAETSEIRHSEEVRKIIDRIISYKLLTEHKKNQSLPVAKNHN